MDNKICRVYSIKQASELTGLPQSFFRRNIKKGNLKVINGSKNPVYITQESLNAFLNDKSEVESEESEHKDLVNE